MSSHPRRPRAPRAPRSPLAAAIAAALPDGKPTPPKRPRRTLSAYLAHLTPDERAIMRRTELEQTLRDQIEAACLPAPEAQEVRLVPGRRFRGDIGWPAYRVVVEAEGGTWYAPEDAALGKRGRHTTGKGFRDDCEKYNLAALEGWLILRFTADMIRDELAVPLIAHALTLRGFRRDQS